MPSKRTRRTRRREPITPDTRLRVALYTRRSTDDQNQPAAGPTPADLDYIRQHVTAVMAQGSPQGRKALFEALIEAIEINSDNTLTPVYESP
jgi:DNA invertase Pin-like site-specific DNA recombinase